MIYPELTRQSERDRAASTLRRWRQIRDQSLATAAQLNDTNDRYMTGRNIEWASARYFTGMAEGYRDCLRDLFG